MNFYGILVYCNPSHPLLAQRKVTESILSWMGDWLKENHPELIF